VLPQFGQALTGDKADLDRPDEFGLVVGVNLGCCRSIEAVKHAMEIPRSSTAGLLPESGSQLIRTLGAREKTFDESAQIEAGASHYDGQMAARVDFTKDLSGHPRILTRRDTAFRIYAVEQMVGNTRAFGRRRLRRTDLKFAVQSDRIAVHNFPVKALGQNQRKDGFSAARGSEHHHQRRFRRFLQRVLQRDVSEDFFFGWRVAPRASTGLL